MNKNTLLADLLRWVFVTTLMFAPSAYAEVKKELLVFVPSSLGARTITDGFSTACSDIDVSVVNRNRDFWEIMEDDGNIPGAILTPAQVIDEIDNYTVALEGHENDKNTEQYLLVSVDKKVDKSNLKGSRIGVIDILGRKRMGRFINKLLNDDVKIKRVTKEEDLLPLLSFGAAQSVLTSNRIFAKLKAKSNLNLVASNLDIRLGLPSVGFPDETLGQSPVSKDMLASCLQSVDENIKSHFGVDGWRAP